jgi:hypothetical protein
VNPQESNGKPMTVSELRELARTAPEGAFLAPEKPAKYVLLAFDGYPEYEQIRAFGPFESLEDAWAALDCFWDGMNKARSDVGITADVHTLVKVIPLITI